MGDSFQGSDTIRVQPGDTNVPYQFSFSVASSSGRADGALPFGSTLVSVTCDAHLGVDKTVVSTGNLVQSTSDFTYNGNSVIIPLTYSTGLASATYHLEMRATATIQGNTSNLFTKQYDYNRVEVKDF